MARLLLPWSYLPLPTGWAGAGTVSVPAEAQAAGLADAQPGWLKPFCRSQQGTEELWRGQGQGQGQAPSGGRVGRWSVRLQQTRTLS